MRDLLILVKSQLCHFPHLLIVFTVFPGTSLEVFFLFVFCLFVFVFFNNSLIYLYCRSLWPMAFSIWMLTRWCQEQLDGQAYTDLVFNMTLNVFDRFYHIPNHERVCPLSSCVFLGKKKKKYIFFSTTNVLGKKFLTWFNLVSFLVTSQTCHFKGGVSNFYIHCKISLLYIK